MAAVYPFTFANTTFTNTVPAVYINEKKDFGTVYEGHY